MQRRGNARTSHHRGQRLLHTLLITANLLGCHSTARGVAADSPPQSARAAPSFGLTLGSPLLPAVPPGSISATEEAEAATRALDYLAESDPNRVTLRKEILRAYLARANEALDRGLADDAYESFSAALRLFDVRELTPPRADVRLPAVDAPGLLPLAQRIDAAFRRRGAHEQVVTALLVQMTLAPADAGPRARLIELARWLSGEPTTTAPVPSDRILVPIGGGGSEPVPKGEDESKRGSGRSARKAARARPKGEDAAPASTAAIPPHLLAAVDEPAPALLRDLEQAFRLWPAPAVVQELAALYQREAVLPSLSGMDLSQLRGPRDLLNFSLRQRSPLNAPGFKLTRLYLRIGRPQEALASLSRLPRQNPQEKLLANLLGGAFRPGAAALDIVRLAVTLAQNPDDLEPALRTCQDLALREPTQVLAHQCTADLAVQSGRKGLALRAAEEARAQKPGDRALWERALRLYQDRLGDLAIDETARDLTGAMGVIEAYMDRMRKAFASQGEGQELNVQLALTLAEVGRGDYNHGRIDQAVASLNRSIGIEPSAAALEQLGLIQLKRGQAAAAMSSLERARALQLSDKRLEPLLKLYFKARIGRLISDALEAQAAQAGAAGKGTGNAAELRESALELRQKTLKDWEQVLSVEQILPERRADAELERAKLLYQVGDREEALRAFQQAIESVPEDERGRDNGQVYADTIAFLVQQGELVEAQSAYRRALGRAKVVEYLKVYCSLWINDLALRAGQPEDPLATAYLRSVSGGKWYAELARWAVGKRAAADDSALLARADTVGKRAEAQFYLGLSRLREGQKTQADELFRKVLASDMMAFFEYEMAANYLRRGAPTAPLLSSAPAEGRGASGAGSKDVTRGKERRGAPVAKPKRPAGSI